MRIKVRTLYLAALCGLLITGCKSCTPKKENAITDALTKFKERKLSSGSLTFNFSVNPSASQFTMPALHSFASASYNGLWVFIGGRKNGFHGTSNNPVPFKTKTANDSIWVVDFAGKQSWGIPVPSAYYYALTATNSAFCQSGNSLYLCGGFSRTDSTSTVFNATSNTFFEFNLPNLIQYVQSGGSNPSLSQVITKVISSPYVQVTGGELLMTNGNFYLIGGQNYNSTYSSGITGIYTNAVRKFNLQQVGGIWTIADTVSVLDPVNLHRRDMNVILYSLNGHRSAVIYGGVFTGKGEAYLNPVNITGLDSGQPVVRVDSVRQIVNQYTCAKATIWFGDDFPVLTAFLGGITYEEYDPQAGKLIIGDHGVPMPFSNLVSVIFKYSFFSPTEFVQLPPNAPLLPAYIGSNGQFIPLPQFARTNHPDMLDGNKIINSITGSSTMIGYLYGGILSQGPTSGTTVNGFVATSANPVLYEVYLNLQ